MKPKLPTSAKIMPYINEIDKCRIYSNFGPQSEALTIRYGKFFGVNPKQVVIVSNGTLAILAGIYSSNFKNIQVPVFTFASTLSLNLQSNLRVKYVDIDKLTWTINCKNDKNSLQLHVLPFGSSIANIELLSQPNVIVDAAASILNINFLNIKMHENTIVMFSLHATKIAGCGEGSILVCGSEEKAQQIKKLINFGFNSNREVEILGSNMKLSEYSAAIAQASLDELPETERQFRRLTQIKNKINEKLNIQPSFVINSDITPYWIVKLENNKHRIEVTKKLDRLNVEHRLWWGNGIHKEKVFANIKMGKFQNAEDIGSSYLGLPFYLDMTDEEINRIILGLT